MKSVTVVKVGKLMAENEADRGKLRVCDIPEPVLGDEGIRIKVAYCSICGSDPHLLQENVFGWDVPFGLGHEMSGVILEVGEKATKKGFKPGDRVAGNFLRFCGTCYYCQNGQQQFCKHADESNQPCMSEYITWHESQAYKLPDDVSLKKGCLLEPVSVAVRAVDKIGPRIGQRVAICGGGPIGLLVLQGLKMMGAVNLTLIEPIAERRALAEKFGADFVVDPAARDVVGAATEITGGLGYDVVVDCSGSVRAVTTLPEITAKGGLLMYSAMYPNDYEMPLNLYKYCYANELTITGIYVSPYAFPRAAQIMPRLQLDDFVASVFDIDDAEEAFKTQISGKYPKILIRCNHFDGE
ncbi:MAG: alcohol dehydrogenase catalytic domain-containing protein [Oscillospiraceae bacterium]|jgi:(R,R)-butanediol dehydrogenase/meso-butanediol dehydrogenase/diacetyl reductase/L-iditol 2-dehydrogenase|nr:alcohol dehydrogenase catalytic domain-containing protein [Oscillospiraceae bacterium]